MNAPKSVEAKTHAAERQARAHVDVWRDERDRADNAEALVQVMLSALRGVVRVADRKTVEFDAARSAIAKAEATATEAQHAGQWVLVPREPTEEIIGSVHWVRVRGEHTTEHVMAQAYRAMIAAAPSPPAAGQWRPIESAPKTWRSFSGGADGTWDTPWMLCGKFHPWGFCSWVGMLDADMWLGRNDSACCFDTETPDVWAPLLAPPPAAPPSPAPPSSEREGSRAGEEPPGPVNCTHVLRRQGKAYPRTCERCGLGPCPFYSNDGTVKP